jgi:hypothetical protein
MCCRQLISASHFVMNEHSCVQRYPSGARTSAGAAPLPRSVSAQDCAALSLNCATSIGSSQGLTTGSAGRRATATSWHELTNRAAGQAGVIVVNDRGDGIGRHRRMNRLQALIHLLDSHPFA